MIREATAIHTTYPEYFNNDPQNLIPGRDEPLPCRMFPAGGLFRSPPESDQRRSLCDHHHKRYAQRRAGDGNLLNLAEDEKNALVFVGYQADGTQGGRIQKGWREVPMGRKGTITINLEIDTIDGSQGIPTGGS